MFLKKLSLFFKKLIFSFYVHNINIPISYWIKCLKIQKLKDLLKFLSKRLH